MSNPMPSHRVTSEQAQTIADDFIATHIGDQVTVGIPWQVDDGDKLAWVVPMVLTHTAVGSSSTIGVLIVEGRSGRIVAGTPKKIVLESASRFRQTQFTELESSLRRLRATGELSA
ncbi:MAG: hypothetical protein IPL78_12995 [Chloroflexi bacterium]|nr:hypothetical protein [Chloroflexota bacterium]